MLHTKELLQKFSFDLGSWPSRVRSMPDAKDVLYFLYKEWISGALSDGLRQSYPHLSARELEREIGRALHALPEEYFDRDEIPIESSKMPDDAALTRWCWASHWILFSDDEDLMFSIEAHFPIMLEEARHGCTKKEYVLAIVAHMLRDHAHGSLWEARPGFVKRLKAGVGLGSEASYASGYLRYLDSIRRIKDAASENQAEAIMAYLERLFGYREPREVTEEEAGQRVFDLRRCYASPNLKPKILSKAGYWVCELQKANISAGVLLIEKKTGAMWAEETKAFFSTR